MVEKVLNAVLRFGLFDTGDTVTVAVSGGADSMALLSALIELRKTLGINVSAAHFNHKIRGEEAKRDQQFVENYCKENEITLFLGSHDVPTFARENNLSLELAARKLRYEFFEGIETDYVATAHTSSDNLETVVLNLTRGTALSGVCGIPFKRGKFVRPLLLCTRDEIEDYCRQRALPYITDSTNLCDDYTRNKIRHNIVPLLKEINPSAENAVIRASISLREDEDFIDCIAKQEYDARYSNCILSVAQFNKLHPAIAKRIIARYYGNFCSEVDNFHINAIYKICLEGGKISLPGNNYAFCDSGKLKIVSCEESKVKPTYSVEISKKANDLFEEDKKIHNLLLKNTLDCDKIVGKLVCRTRTSGDKIKLKNKNGTKSLKKLFTEYSVPVNERDVWPLLCDDEGLVWVYKIGVAHRCAAGSDSKQIYRISVKKTMGDFADE